MIQVDIGNLLTGNIETPVSENDKPHDENTTRTQAAVERFFIARPRHNPHMDEIVKQALAKWPDVPACYGWLGLDARGRWYMRDAQVQALGAFPAARGAQLLHDKLLAFIHRNYQADEAGCWFFQNGPQRVYVELEVTPLVWRMQAGQPIAHTGQASGRVRACWVDELGRVYLHCALGVGLVHSLDVYDVAQELERGRWQVQEVESSDVPRLGGFVRSPAKP